MKYVILAGATQFSPKLSPQYIGPFDSYDEARAFIETDIAAPCAIIPLMPQGVFTGELKFDDVYAEVR